MKDELPDFGKYLAVDGKPIDTHANGKKRGVEEKEADGRRDTDADWGKKVYRGVREDGTAWEKVKSWFGYKLHLVVDAKYELPVSYCVTKASAAEVLKAHELFEKIKEGHPEVIERCEYGIADRGYDDGKLIEKLWDDYDIKPVIDIRIPLEEDRRIFTPLARSSYRWKSIYKKRTAVERVNSRLDVSFGFEQHYIRGLKKMKLRCSLAMCIMLAMALGRVKEKQKDYMRSLVRAA